MKHKVDRTNPDESKVEKMMFEVMYETGGVKKTETWTMQQLAERIQIPEDKYTFADLTILRDVYDYNELMWERRFGRRRK